MKSHPETTVARALFFRTRGVSYTRIARRLEELDGVKVSAETVKSWCLGRQRVPRGI